MLRERNVPDAGDRDAGTGLLGSAVETVPYGRHAPHAHICRRQTDRGPANVRGRRWPELEVGASWSTHENVHGPTPHVDPGGNGPEREPT